MPLAATCEHEFGSDTNNTEQVYSLLYTMVESAGAALRKQGLAAGRSGIVLDYSDGSRVVLSQSVRPLSANDIRLFEISKQVLDKAWHRRIRIRHLRHTCDRLSSGPIQLPIFDIQREEWERNERIVATLDAVRARFGKEAIRTGRASRV